MEPKAKLNGRGEFSVPLRRRGLEQRSSARSSALNFGWDDHLDHDERYRRARDFHDVVTGLWDSFGEDAFVRTVNSSIYFNPNRGFREP